MYPLPYCLPSTAADEPRLFWNRLLHKRLESERQQVIVKVEKNLTGDNFGKVDVRLDHLVLEHHLDQKHWQLACLLGLESYHTQPKKWMECGLLVGEFGEMKLQGLFNATTPLSPRPIFIYLLALLL